MNSRSPSYSWIIMPIMALVFILLIDAISQHTQAAQRRAQEGWARYDAMYGNNPDRVTRDPKDVDIRATLINVQRELNRNRDVNKDGLVNCIDAAVLFYKYYPNKNEVCIEVNKNPGNGFHHLFNCVYLDGAWKAIEPQAYWKGYNSYWIRSVWPKEYDRKYNRDVTVDYLKYTR